MVWRPSPSKRWVGSEGLGIPSPHLGCHLFGSILNLDISLRASGTWQSRWCRCCLRSTGCVLLGDDHLEMFVFCAIAWLRSSSWSSHIFFPSVLRMGRHQTGVKHHLTSTESKVETFMRDPTNGTFAASISHDTTFEKCVSSMCSFGIFVEHAL